MSRDAIDYDSLTQEAMRGVVRSVLQRVARSGLPGDHHFYISFRTTAPGVALSRRLMERWPEEMTIVLQNQFSDLRVYEDRFEVMLSFDRIPERLVIPFESIKVFFDPSVPFGHQFEQSEQIPMVRMGEPGDTAERGAKPLPPAKSERTTRHLPAENGAAPRAAKPVKVDPPKAAPPAETPAPGKVVELDAFRKK